MLHLSLCWCSRNTRLTLSSVFRLACFWSTNRTCGQASGVTVKGLFLFFNSLSFWFAIIVAIVVCLVLWVSRDGAQAGLKLTILLHSPDDCDYWHGSQHLATTFFLFITFSVCSCGCICVYVHAHVCREETISIEIGLWGCVCEQLSWLIIDEWCRKAQPTVS